MKVSEYTSNKIANMGFLCAILVVCIHVSFDNQTSLLSVLFKDVVQRGMASVAVPYYFAAAGYLMAGHFDEEKWYAKEVRKRCSTLLVPYFTWILLIFCLTLPLLIMADKLGGRSFGTSLAMFGNDWVATLGLDVLSPPLGYGGPLWFLRCLFFLSLCSPVFKFLVFRFGGVWLCVAFLLNLMHKSFGWTSVPWLHDLLGMGFSISGCFYYSLGIYLRSPRCGRCATMRQPISCLLLVLLLACKAMASHFLTHFPVDVNALFIPGLLYALWMLVPSVRWPSWLVGCAFPLYLVHVGVLGYVSTLLKHTPLNNTFFGSVLLLLCVTGVSLLLIVALTRFLPAFAGFLFAGRNCRRR